MNKVQQVQALIAVARMYIMDWHKEPCAPYVSNLLLNLTPVPVPGLKYAMGVTDSLVLYFNPDLILDDPELSRKEVMAGALMHELEHIIRGMWRLEALPDKERGNIAGDIAINGDLRKEKWELPSWVYYHDLPQFNFPPNLALEQYYELLSEKAKEHGGSTLRMMNETLGEDDGSGNKVWMPKLGAGGCGSAGGSAPDQAAEAYANSIAGRPEAEVESIIQSTYDALEEWAQAHSSNIGTESGRYKEILKHRHKKPDVNWRATLRRSIRSTITSIRSGSRDYSMLRPSMSSAFLGVVLPGLIDGIPEITFIRDTSGSMGAPQLQSANNEIIGAVKRAGVQSFTLIDADVDVHQVRRITSREVPRVPILGRGGTAFTPAIQVALKNRPRPNLIIYLTDGCGDNPPPVPKHVSFIWCIVRGAGTRIPAPWGRVVVCDKNPVL